MAELTDAQRKRAEARKRRKSQGESNEPETEAEPMEEGNAHEGMKQAAKVAAASAAVGAAAAAARALTSHRDGAQEDIEDQAAQPEEPEQPADEAPEGDEAPEDDQAPEPDEAPESREDSEPEPEPVAGADASDARAVVDRAREQLEELLERRVESVSSLERTHDGWVARLEVVELSRVPESTDVLGSYEMELDEDRNLRRYEQVRRYHRGRADLGEDS